MTPKKELPSEAPGKQNIPSDVQSSTAEVNQAMADGRSATKENSDSLNVESAQVRNIGRPRTRLEALKTVPTRCPSQIYTYLKGISPFLYGSLTEMFEDMMTRFLKERPWDHGLHWRRPKTSTTFAGGEQGRTGWEQINMQLPPKLADEVSKRSDECGVSNAAFCYTAIFWWVQYIYPPEKMMPKK